MAIRVPPGGSSLGSFLVTTSGLAFGRPRSQIVNGWAPDVAAAIGVGAAAEQRTNLALWSGDIANASWNGFSNGTGTVSRTGNAGDDPDGFTTATLVTIDRSNVTSWAQGFATSFTSVGGAYTGSIWLKAYQPADVGKVIDIAFSDGTTQVFTHITLTADWVRYTLTATLLAASGQFLGGYADNTFWPGVAPTTGQTQFFATWGQVELGATVSDYIPTTTVAVTRPATYGVAAAAAVTTNTGFVGIPAATGSGTLVADAAAAASTAGISRSLITDTTLAADAAVAASTTGLSASLITDTTLVADAAVVVSTTGVSRSLNTANALAAQAAVVASTTGISRSLITDTTLAADPAVVVSTTGVSRSLITDTTIDAGAAAVVSTAGLVRSINTANTLAAQAAAVASTTGLSRSIAPSSALAPQQATVSGVGGTGTALFGTGVLNVLPAAVAGAGLSAVTGAGVLQALAANSNGPGLSQFIGTGALFAEWAAIAGLGSIPYSPFVSGPYTQVGDLWEGAAVWGKIDGKWRRMRLWSRSAEAWGMVAWDKDAQEVDVISEPAYGVLAVRSAHVAGSGFIRDQFWGSGDLRAGPALVTDSSSLSGLNVITNAAWEATPVWLKVDGKWRRATMWTNVSEEWKRVA